MSHSFDQVAGALSPFRKVFFEPLYGNNGDKLIELATRKFLADSKITVVSAQVDSDAIIINGGGAMSDMWMGLGILKSYIQSGAKNIVVLPSSYHADERTLADIGRLAEGSGCYLSLFARERLSLYRLKQALGDSANIQLAHDMAFYLTPEDLASKVKSFRRKKPYALIVERNDAESSTNIEKPKPVNIPFKKSVPTWIKRPFKRLLAGPSQKSDFAHRCLETLPQATQPIGIVDTDISNTSLHSFSDFINTVIGAEHVFTTRLHVSILRHIFGKECYLVPTGGEYRKNESVHEHSMATNGHVRIFDPMPREKNA